MPRVLDGVRPGRRSQGRGSFTALCEEVRVPHRARAQSGGFEAHGGFQNEQSEAARSRHKRRREEEDEEDDE